MARSFSVGCWGCSRREHRDPRSETDNAQDLALVQPVGAYFRVPPARQAVIVGEVRAAVRRWRAVALEYALGRGEQDAMAPAFRVAEAG